MEKYFVYISYSVTLDKFYTGHTANLVTRLLQHNTGRSTYTSKANDWVIMFQKEFENRTEANKYELFIKNKKSRKYIESFPLPPQT